MRAAHLAFGPLDIDGDGHRAFLDGKEVLLTHRRFRLLLILAQHAGQALDSRFLLSSMWETPWHGDVTPLQVHISRLRTSLGESAQAPRFIHTVFGYGYRFEDLYAPPQAAASPASVAESRFGQFRQQHHADRMFAQPTVRVGSLFSEHSLLD